MRLIFTSFLILIFTTSANAQNNNLEDSLAIELAIKKIDTNSVSFKNSPKWRREYTKAALNSLIYMNRNFHTFKTDSIDIESFKKANEMVSRQQYNGMYNKKIIKLSQILTERPFTAEEIQIVKNIQKRLLEWSKEGLHPFLDKLSFYTLQEANALALSFNTP